MTMTQWVRNAMEEIIANNYLFHCAFCEKPKHEDDKAICEGPEDICLDCHVSECVVPGACLLEGNF